MLAKLIVTTALAIVVAAGTSFAAASNKPHRAHHPRAERHARAKPVEASPPPEVARLQAFRGVWNFDGTVTIGDNRPRKVRWRVGCSQVAGGWAVACDHTIHIPRMPVLRMHELIAWSNGAIHFYSADNTGETRDTIGKWTSDTALHAHYEGTQGGKPMVEDADFTLHDATTLELTDTVTVGGKPFMAFSGIFHQAPKRARRGRNAAVQEPVPDATSQSQPAPAQ